MGYDGKPHKIRMVSQWCQGSTRTQLTQVLSREVHIDHVWRNPVLCGEVTMMGIGLGGSYDPIPVIYAIILTYINNLCLYHYEKYDLWLDWWYRQWSMIFPESACEGFFVKKQPLYYIFTPSHLLI